MDYGLSWAQNTYDRQEPPDNLFCKNWFGDDEESEDDNDGRSELYPSQSRN